MANPFALIKDIYNASEAGQSLAKPEIWAKRAETTQNLTILVAAMIGVTNQFLDTNIQVSENDLASVVAGVAVVGGYISNRLHVASNPNAGRRKK